MSDLTVRKTASSLRIFNALFVLEFTRQTAGFPSELGLAGEEDSMLLSSFPLLNAKRNNKAISPFLKNGFEPRVIRGSDKVDVYFDDIQWREKSSGKVLDGFSLQLHYEIYDDGAAFVHTFFFTDTFDVGKISDFILSLKVAFPEDCGCNWDLWKFPEGQDASIIQDLSNSERNLNEGENKVSDKNIYPYISFDYGVGDRRDRHIEFFVESWASLAPEHMNIETKIEWGNKEADVSWNFQKKPAAVPGRSLQWRNIWGWCVRKYPVERKTAPLRVVHYLDNFKHYPDSKTVRMAAEEGANVFILHENWRMDIKQDAFAYDIKLLKKTIASCHKYGMRVMLYVRGNEDGMAEDFGGHLSQCLKKDFDGIYMDYGSPVVFNSRSEYSPGGRIHFWKFDKMMRRVRESVGENGLIIGHAGPFFSAVGYTVQDAYLGGEQEKGLLIKNQRLHAFFSKLSTAPTALWTAAFPTYRTPKMLPFLAATGQFPFIHLGTQFPSSSLQHPEIPSVITFARPLWRLWALMDGEKNIRLFSTQNTTDVFELDSKDTGACAIITRKGEILLIASNFSEKERDVEIKVNWKKTGARAGRDAVALAANGEENKYYPASAKNVFKRKLSGFGVCGWLIVDDSKKWIKALDDFTRPYPINKKEEKEFYTSFNLLKERRFNPPQWDECYMRVYVPNFPNNYEDSLWWDLFDNRIELFDFRDSDAPVSIGCLTPKGIKDRIEDNDDTLWPGIKTPWIPLHETIRPSKEKIRIGIKTFKGDFEFYSFVKVELSPRPSVCESTYEVIYHNDIDLDWSLLTFDIINKGGKQ